MTGEVSERDRRLAERPRLVLEDIPEGNYLNNIAMAQAIQDEFDGVCIRVETLVDVLRGELSMEEHRPTESRNMARIGELQTLVNDARAHYDEASAAQLWFYSWVPFLRREAAANSEEGA